MSNKNKNQLKGVNILVCGSEKFDDPAFVFEILHSFYKQTNGNIRKIYTTQFAGSCKFVKSWAEVTNKYLDDDQKIEVVDYLFDSLLKQKNSKLYDSLEIPQEAVERSDFFQEVKERMMAMGVNLVLPFPNKEGKLGVTTKNIALASSLAGIPTLDLSNAYELLKQRKNNIEGDTPAEDSTENKESNSLGFKNRHPSKH